MNELRAEQRVLVLAATAAAAELATPELIAAGLDTTICSSLAEVAREFRENGAAAVVLTESSIDSPDQHELTEALRYQAAWSDLPILFLTRSGAESPVAARWIAQLGNVAVLELPVRSATLRERRAHCRSCASAAI